MRHILHHIRHRKVRASAQSALESSAALPNSGFTFVDNSQGASAAVVELLKSLDTALEHIDLEGKLKWWERTRRRLLIDAM
jgi:hypothetical protein